MCHWSTEGALGEKSIGHHRALKQMLRCTFRLTSPSCWSINTTERLTSWSKSNNIAMLSQLTRRSLQDWLELQFKSVHWFVTKYQITNVPVQGHKEITRSLELTSSFVPQQFTFHTNANKHDLHYRYQCESISDSRKVWRTQNNVLRRRTAERHLTSLHSTSMGSLLLVGAEA